MTGRLGTSLRTPVEKVLPGFGLSIARERVADIQRARILAAMRELCIERGVGDVTVAHVVGRSGVSRRTFYELFADREDCFLAALDDAISRVSRHVLDAYDVEAKWVDRIRASLIALLSFLDAEPGSGWLLVVGSLGAGANALERRRELLAHVLAAVDAARDQARGGAQPPPLTAEGVVGGVLSIVHARLLEADSGSFLELAAPLMGMLVLPYQGIASARRELKRHAPTPLGRSLPKPADPLRDVRMRLTYRTVCVLMSVAAHPSSSNREIGHASGIQDQGQISKLLTRLTKLGLIENSGAGQARGAPNAWVLTPKGQEIERAVGRQAG